MKNTKKNIKDVFPLIYITRGHFKGYYAYYVGKNKWENFVAYIPTVTTAHSGSMGRTFMKKYNVHPRSFWYLNEEDFVYADKNDLYSLLDI